MGAVMLPFNAGNDLKDFIEQLPKLIFVLGLRREWQFRAKV
jgi:hypothetical protein